VSSFPTVLVVYGAIVVRIPKSRVTNHASPGIQVRGQGRAVGRPRGVGGGLGVTLGVAVGVGEGMGL